MKREEIGKNIVWEGLRPTQGELLRMVQELVEAQSQGWDITVLIRKEEDAQTPFKSSPQTSA